MTRAEPTLHPAQARLLRLVAERPGACVQDLARELGVTRTATLYHLHRLAKRGLVLSVRQGRRLSHFPATIRDSSQHTLLGVLRVRTARLLVEQLASEPTLSWRHLAKRLGVTPKAVRWHVKRLQEDRLLQVHDRDGARHVTLLDDGLRALLASGPAPAPSGTAGGRGRGDAPPQAPLAVTPKQRD